MQIRLSCRHRRVSRLVDAVYGLLGELSCEPVSETELDRLRRRVIWEHYGLLDGVAPFSQWVSTMHLQGLPCDIGEHCRRLLAVDATSISRMASKLLHERAHLVAIVGDLGDRAVAEIGEKMTQMLGKTVKTSLL